MILPKIFNRNISNIHHAAFWLSFFALASGVLGLFRDRLLAGIFGATRALDIYYAAFRVPDFIYTFLLFFAAATAIIPVLLKFARDENGEPSSLAKEGEELLGSLLSLFFLAITALSLLAFLGMPYFIKILLPGFSAVDQSTAVIMSRILLLSPFFLGLSNIFSSVTQTFGRFFIYALSPVLYNLGIILGIIFFFPSVGFVGLGWGVALGAFLHVAIQLPYIASFKINFGRLWPSRAGFWHPDLQKVVSLSLPRTLGLATTQVALTVFTAIASTLAHGSIAIFNLATNLQYLPVTLIGVSYSVAAFPTLAALSLKKDKERFREHFSTALRHIVFWALPVAFLILVLRAQIVRVILGSGNFSWEDTRLTAAALSILSLAVVFQSLFTLFTRAFYAEGETLRPFAINLISMLLSIGAAFWLISAFEPGGEFAAFLEEIFRVSDIADIRVLALPVGLLAGSAFNFLFLLAAFRGVFGWFPGKGLGKSFLEIFLASVSGGLAAYFGLRMLAEVFNLNTFLGIFFQGFLAGVLGVVFVTLILWVLKNREFFELCASIRRKFYKEEQASLAESGRVPVPEPEKLP